MSEGSIVMESFAVFPHFFCQILQRIACRKTNQSCRVGGSVLPQRSDTSTVKASNFRLEGGQQFSQ